MTKITPEHLARAAVVYVRQSTAFQVNFNLEMRIPRDRGHEFHGKVGTNSTRWWARIPRDRGR
ncbi:MAG: hypothetical protein JHD15_17995, partial [Phenylobacterium sp.]|uniref:hypothetical protein n=1 Tax=Phenylobacterium sp. TaxID=1871053 RepID=UPI001A2BC116